MIKKTHRFISDFNIRVGEYVITDQELIHQTWDVLKLRSGERIVLCDGNLNEGTATIIERNNSGIVTEIDEVSRNLNEPPREVVLYCAILKSENFELACQKSTEVGVSEIVPVITERTVKLNLRYDRLQKIIKEAAEQSGRGRVPKLNEALSLEDAIKDAKRCAIRLCFDASGSSLDDSRFKTQDSRSGAIFIGPEGGWSDNELKQFKENSFGIVTLGPRVLRAETAATIGTYLAAR